MTPTTCAMILTRNPAAPTGTYDVDPDADGPGEPFQVRCEMDIDNGGWTLVALEKAGVTQTLRFLGTETGTPADLVQDQSAIIGVRFHGLYNEVRIHWDGTRFIKFSLSGSDIFENNTDVNLPIANLSTNQPQLMNWVNMSGGAKLCRAAADPMYLPGDTSWAIKPTNNNEIECGCNSMG
jgi:hypothetical protein